MSDTKRRTILGAILVLVVGIALAAIPRPTIKPLPADIGPTIISADPPEEARPRIVISRKGVEGTNFLPPRIMCNDDWVELDIAINLSNNMVMFYEGFDIVAINTETGDCTVDGNISPGALKAIKQLIPKAKLLTPLEPNIADTD